MTDQPRTLVQIVRIPAEGVAPFQQYEDRVLPLLAEHGGTLDARYRGVDATVEVHVVSFTSEHAMTAYIDDPRRQAAQPLLVESAAQVERLLVSRIS